MPKGSTRWNTRLPVTAIASDPMTTICGETEPIVETADGAAEARNRRVEITVSALGT